LIDAVPGPSIGSVLYYQNQGVVSGTGFVITFNEPVTIADCSKIYFRNTSVGYNVPVGVCSASGNKVTVRATPHCAPKLQDIMCNGHNYTLYVQAGAVRNLKGVLLVTPANRSFRVDPN
jgi:hypothetical protein